ncbi:hypothetical protein SAMN06297468_1222 [Altererythrobacter xiamenensis]|uniref:Uncharacterized protein n=1 Tax=Altererythrobacter xiamenensis TaxID=1316679 RepID=A0A1Y6F297_9SPHN|nr:hypothetical protein [Altererythrobacter xiamenensis]SMQ68955.1 hypothetical protein SAMN06297468_1222 [Altererythrobacter xiamenensis]
MNFSRRMALRCGLAGIFVAAGPAWAAGSTAYPAGPMQLGRRLERGLSDGEAIIVDRHWAVDFNGRGPGILIRGNQISVEVEAPAPLARIAQIEEQRDTSAMFPIELSADGQIVDAGDVDDSDEMAAAVQLAQSMIAHAGLDVSDHRRHLAAIEAAGTQLLDTMPRDLFFPRDTAWTDRRTLALPGGKTGVIAVRYEAERCVGAPWLARANRTVTTAVADTTRISRETWTLSPA